MKTKIVLLAILPLFIAGTTNAQDKIFKSNGNVIEAKVVLVNSDNVIYKSWGNQDGPDHSIAKSDVDKIKYENGKEEVYSNASAVIHDHSSQEGTGRHHMNMSNALIAIAPIQFTENGVGLAVNFEKAIDKDGIISYNLPAIATFNLNNSSDNGQKQDPMFYFSPGIKFYPTGMFGKTKFAIGPSLVIGAGEKTTSQNYSTYDPVHSTYTYYNSLTTRSKFILGIMVSNSLNINPTPHFYLGLDFGFGITYINKLDGANQGLNGIVQGGFKLGYRF